MSLESYILGLSDKRRLSLADRAAAGGLSLLEKLYIRGVTRRRERDQAGAVHAGIPVISIGNVTAGGTGKTPCIAWLAGCLQAAGRHPAILTRGYKGGMEYTGGIVSDGKKILASPVRAGDEPYMLAVKLPGVPVLVGRDRVASAAAAKALGADVLLLDDGFQYWKLARDLDIVLIDCTKPFGGGRVLPRGLLREPMGALARAGLFILTKAGQADAETVRSIQEVLCQYAPDAPVVYSNHTPGTLVKIWDWPADKPAYVPRGMAVHLVSGIGNPGAFKKTAEEAGLSVAGQTVFPDHHNYTENELECAWKVAHQDGAAEALVVTEKDAVKIQPVIQDWSPRFQIYVLGIRMTFSGDGEVVCMKKVEAVL